MASGFGPVPQSSDKGPGPWAGRAWVRTARTDGAGGVALEIVLLRLLLRARAPAADPTAVPLLALRRWMDDELDPVVAGAVSESGRALDLDFGSGGGPVGGDRASKAEAGAGPARARPPGRVGVAATWVLGKAGGVLLGTTVVAWTVSQSPHMTTSRAGTASPCSCGRRASRKLVFEQGVLAP